LFGGGLDQGVCTKLRRYQHAPELITRLDLRPVPARPLPMLFYNTGWVASEVVPDDHQALDEHAERRGRRYATPTPALIALIEYR
jgi:hypothetical protein